MLLCGGCDDYTSWINGKSRRERPSPSEALRLPRNLGECGQCGCRGRIKAWERLTINMARFALLYTGVCFTVMKSSKPQYCLASRKLNSNWKRGYRLKGRV